MKTTLTYTGALAAVLTMAGFAVAETGPASAGAVFAGGYVDPGSNYGYRASTYEEGVLRGLGALGRSIGEMNYYNSLANINAQEAYNRYLQNREQATETYFRMRQINRAARQSERPQRLTYEQYVALAKKAAPDGLNDAQYDRTLGRLNWPAALWGDEFAPEREALSRAFLVRSPSDVGPATPFYASVQQITASMQGKLLGKIDQLTPAEYLAAKKFVTGLAYESQQPVAVRALASR